MAVAAAYDGGLSAYPAHLETDVVLRDGSTAHVRPARADDLERLESYFISLSDESRRLRFGGLSVNVREQARRAVEIDYVQHRRCSRLQAPTSPRWSAERNTSARAVPVPRFVAAFFANQPVG
jgi:hypothetical protein